MPDSNANYFVRRAQQERSAARTAIEPHIAAVHDEMAELYETAARVAGAHLESAAPHIGAAAQG
jgi:hypothetical protein